MTLVLASRSPQRAAILRQLHVPFRVVAPDYDEPALPLAPPALVEAHSAAKARVAAATTSERPVLGVDTLVVLDDVVLGKPADEAAAGSMLRALAGRRHTVLSGLTLIRHDGEVTGHAATDVWFRPLHEADAEDLLARGEWRGRAGGYAIQEAGAALVERVDGDFYNVVGLPVDLLVRSAGGISALRR